MTSADRDTGRDVDTADTAGPADVDAPEGEREVEPEVERDAPAADEPEHRSGLGPKLPVIALTTAVALVVAAATVAVWFGVAWLRAANDDGLAYSGTRDEVDRVAQSGIVTMNTLDYRSLDEGLANWADATTGALYDEISKVTDDQKQALKDAKSVSSATVSASAVKELDDRAGRAEVIASIKKVGSVGDQEPATTYQRILATLVRTDGGWKLENVVPLTSAQSGQ